MMQAVIPAAVAEAAAEVEAVAEAEAVPRYSLELPPVLPPLYPQSCSPIVG